MDADEALAVLGLDRAASWADIRRQYRSRIRAAHPDVSADADGATRVTADLNEAYAVLVVATRSGTHPIAVPEAPLPARTESESTIVLPGVSGATGDVFGLLLEAGHRIGSVSYVSPEEGLLQILVEPREGPRCQLMAEIVATAPVRVAFSLVSLDSGSPPPIEVVVGDMLAAVRAELRH